MSLQLEPLLDYHVDLEFPRLVGPGPYGNRWVFDVKGGTFKFHESGMTGTLRPSGGDWMLVGQDNVGRLDVRVMLETTDEALIYMQFRGVLELNDLVAAAASGTREPEFEDAYFVTQPRFETGDTRYAWLNRSVGLAEGKVGQNRAWYRVYRAVQG